MVESTPDHQLGSTLRPLQPVKEELLPPGLTRKFLDSVLGRPEPSIFMVGQCFLVSRTHTFTCLDMACDCEISISQALAPSKKSRHVSPRQLPHDRKALGYWVAAGTMRNSKSNVIQTVTIWMKPPRIPCS